MATINRFAISQRRPKGRLCHEERLREEHRGRAVVVVGIVDPVGIELNLAVIEVEDRGVRELGLVTRCLSSSVRGTGTRE
jgi:hypothetical protein